MMDSTTAIITTTDNRVLLQKRDENPDIEYSGCYSLVSGYLEEEETPLAVSYTHLDVYKRQFIYLLIRDIYFLCKNKQSFEN